MCTSLLLREKKHLWENEIKVYFRPTLYLQTLGWKKLLNFSIDRFKTVNSITTRKQQSLHKAKCNVFHLQKVLPSNGIFTKESKIFSFSFLSASLELAVFLSLEAKTVIQTKFEKKKSWKFFDKTFWWNSPHGTHKSLATTHPHKYRITLRLYPYQIKPRFGLAMVSVLVSS